MLLPIAYISAFVAIVMIVQAVATTVFAVGDRSRRVNRRLTMLDSGMSQDQVYTALVRKAPGTRLSTLAPQLYDKVYIFCRQAGFSMSPQRLAIIAAGVAVALALAATVLLSVIMRGAVVVNLLVSTVGAIVIAIVGVGIWVNNRRAKRLRQIEEQLPLALDILVRSIRAGHPVSMAVKLSADEMGDPIGSEFGLIVDETTYGLELREALANFAHRTGSSYAHFFAVSVAIQTETGGNLAEILFNLSTVIRAQQTLHLRVKALAAEGKMSALILSVLPILLIAFLMVSQPAFYTVHFKDPVFWPTVAVIAVLYMLGRFIIMRIVNFRY
jgi:tight adherence protein B